MRLDKGLWLRQWFSMWHVHVCVCIYVRLGAGCYDWQSSIIGWASLAWIYFPWGWKEGWGQKEPGEAGSNKCLHLIGWQMVKLGSHTAIFSHCTASAPYHRIAIAKKKKIFHQTCKKKNLYISYRNANAA